MDMTDHTTPRFRFDAAQLTQYFDRIKLPPAKRHRSVTSCGEQEKLAYLQLIFKHQLITIPWDNLIMHYSWHHIVHVNPLHLFRKIVDTPQRGRGGYCFEANVLFHHILYSLGFDVYMAGSRIYSASTGSYGGWSHVVNLVTVQGIKYVVDGGYGGNGLTEAIPLEHGREHVHVGHSHMRLMHESISQNLDRAQKLWLYQHRIDVDRDWTTMFCFTELEFLPEDIERLNIGVHSWRHTFFGHKVVAVRFTTAHEKLSGDEEPGYAEEKDLEGEIDGAITLAHDHLYWRRNGKKVVNIRLKNEEERLAALKKFFGIELKEEEIRGIAETSAELVEAPFSV